MAQVSEEGYIVLGRDRGVTCVAIDGSSQRHSCFLAPRKVDTFLADLGENATGEDLGVTY